MNGSFENYSTLPTAMGQWHVVNGWANAGSLLASPDYYHYNGTWSCDLPETALAMVDPNQGSAIMGIIACGRPLTNIREYLSTDFTTPLLLGKKYVVGFKITNGIKTTTSLSGLGVDKLGLYFSVGPTIQTGQEPIMATPQLVINEVVYNQEWQTVNFIFEPDQAYTHMTFGLFGDDTDKSITVIEGGDPQFGYYFLDSFVIEKIATNFDHPFGDKGVVDDHGNGSGHQIAISEEPFFVPNTFTPNDDGENEVFKPVSNTLKEWEFEIFTKWGDRIFYTSDENAGWDGAYNTMHCENGSYVWQMSYIILDDSQHPKLVESRGIVNLVR